MSIDLRLRHDRSTRERAAEMFERGSATDPSPRSLAFRRGCERLAGEVPSDREGRAPRHGWKAGKIRLRDQGRRGQRRGRRRDGQARSDGALRHRERDVAEAVVQAVPRGRRRRAPAQAEGQAEGLGREGRAGDPRAGARTRGPQARGAVAYLKKSIALKAELGLPLGTGRRP